MIKLHVSKFVVKHHGEAIWGYNAGENVQEIPDNILSELQLDFEFGDVLERIYENRNSDAEAEEQFCRLVHYVFQGANSDVILKHNPTIDDELSFEITVENAEEKHEIVPIHYVGMRINFVLTNDPDWDVQKYIDEAVNPDKIYELDLVRYSDKFSREFFDWEYEQAKSYVLEDYIKPAAEKFGLKVEDIKIGSVDFDWIVEE